MPNRLMTFPGNVPPEKIQLYWDEEHQQWEVWFGDEAPWVKDAEFTPFNYKLYDYTRDKPGP